jgi:hypothetical protein
VTVHPGELLTVWILATRPACSDGEVLRLDTVALRWKALGVPHRYELPVAVGSTRTPLFLCYPRRALDHLYDAP